MKKKNFGGNLDLPTPSPLTLDAPMVVAFTEKMNPLRTKKNY